MAEECPHGGDPATCPPCNPTGRLAPLRGHADATTIAGYYGRCPRCNGLIEAGDRIYLYDDAWVCEDCDKAAVHA